MTKIKKKIVSGILSSAVVFSLAWAEKPADTGEAKKSSQSVNDGWSQCLYPETVTKQEVYNALKPFIKGHEVFDVRKSPLPGIYEVIFVREGKIIPVYIDCNLEHFF